MGGPGRPACDEVWLFDKSYAVAFKGLGCGGFLGQEGWL